MKTAYIGGKIYTGALPLQQAFLEEDGKFIAVGSDAAVLAREPDLVKELDGSFVCAGFNDSHMHLLNLGQALSVAPLHLYTGSLREMLLCLKAMQPGRGGWILGRGWNQDLFRDETRMPTRRDLDAVSTDYPVCAVRACGHAMAVNSKALELLNITEHTPRIPGGEIVMENGCPNGILFDNAMDLVYAAIPAPTKEELKDMLRAACQMLNSYGITSCQSDDYCVFQTVPWQNIHQAYRELEAEGSLTVRVYEQANFTTPASLSAFLDAGNLTGNGTAFFKIGPLKMLGDGALGARTAYLTAPYADDPATRGLSVFTPEVFDEMIGRAHQQGMQVAVHCIGDGCLDLVLNSLEKALTEFPREDHRHGIVHCQITRPDQLERIAKLKLHVYAQSIFLDYDLHIVEDRVGKALAQSSYSWKTVMDQGVCVSNGSDCPVELPNVMGGIQCAVTRCDLKGAGPYLPAEAFTVQQALDSFTKAGARASFEEAVKGQIRPGMLADFVVLGEDPFETDPGKLKDIPILATYLGGKQVFSRSAP